MAYEYPESSEVGKLGTVAMDVASEEFWDANALREEMLRQIDVCHGCRLCLPLCPDFPRLFDHIDDEVDGDVPKLTDQHLTDFTDWCYQCKLCFLKCPYTPPHEFMIDIPKLLLRAKAVRARQQGGATRQDRLLGNTDGNGQLAKRLAPLANAGMGFKPGRMVMESVTGIHRDRILPKWHAQTFKDWFNHRPNAQKSTGASRKVALFYTCVVNYNEPEVGQAIVKVLEHNDVEVAIVEERCCGQPQLDGGEIDKAMAKMRFNAASLRRMIDQGYEIVVPEPTCGMMLKKEYASFIPAEMEGLVPHIFEVTEYLMKMHADGQLKTNFTKQGKLAYHMPCHLKYQAIGQQTLHLLRLISDDVVFVDKGCSGMDGTWGMKKQYFEASLKVARGLIAGMKEAQPATCVTDCALSGLQITQGTGLKALHPYQLLQQAYGL